MLLLPIMFSKISKICVRLDDVRPYGMWMCWIHIGFHVWLFVRGSTQQILSYRGPPPRIARPLWYLDTRLLRKKSPALLQYCAGTNHSAICLQAWPSPTWMLTMLCNAIFFDTSIYMFDQRSHSRTIKLVPITSLGHCPNPGRCSSFVYLPLKRAETPVWLAGLGSLHVLTHASSEVWAQPTGFTADPWQDPAVPICSSIYCDRSDKGIYARQPGHKGWSNEAVGEKVGDAGGV